MQSTQNSTLLFFFPKDLLFCPQHNTTDIYCTSRRVYIFSFLFLRLSSVFFFLPELFLKMNQRNISFDLFAISLKKKKLNNQEERDGVSLQGYLYKIYYAINWHAWNSQIKRLKFNLKAHATRKWNHSVSYISQNEKTLGTKRCRERGRTKDTVLLCRAREHPAEQDRGRRARSRARGTAWLAALQFSCCREGVPRMSESKTWQAIWELDGKGERLGIKNDHFPEIKTKTSHQFLPCITEGMRIPVYINSTILPLTPSFMLACTRFFTIYQKEKTAVLFIEWYK